MKYFMFYMCFFAFPLLCYCQDNNTNIKKADYCELLDKLLSDRYIIEHTGAAIDTNIEETVRVAINGEFCHCTNLKFYKKKFIKYEQNDSANEAREHYQIILWYSKGMYISTFATFPTGYTIFKYYKRKKNKWLFVKKEWGVQ